MRIRPRATTATGRTVSFADGDATEFDAVVWATGFTADHSWINIPSAKDEQGRIRHTRGVTPAPGLYMLGLTWQHTRTSALLGWVGNDAAYLATRIALSHPLMSPTSTDRQLGLDAATSAWTKTTTR